MENTDNPPLRGSASSEPSTPTPVPASNPDAHTFVLQVPENAESDFSVTDLKRRVQLIWRMVWERWWAGAIAALAVALPLVYHLLQQPVDAVASTTVLVESNLDEVLEGRRWGSPEEMDMAIKNHLSYLSSRAFFTRLAATFTADEALAIQQPYLEPDQEPSAGNLAGLLSGLVTVERERGRTLFTISASHRDPAFALQITGRVSSEFQASLQDEKQLARGSATEILRRQADTLAEEIEKLSDERREYRMQHNLITVQENQGILAERLRTINQALSQFRVSRVGLESQLEQAVHDLDKSPTPWENPVLSSFGDLPKLRGELERVRNNQIGLSTELGPNHPAMREALRNVVALEELIASNFRLALQDLRGKLDLARASQEQMSAELTAAFNQSLELDKLAGGFNRLTDELAAKGEALTALRQQIEHTTITANRPTEGMVTVDAPYIRYGSGLRRLYLLAGVGILGLMFFFAVPVGLYLWSERLSGSMDIENIFHKEVLGVIPRFSRVKVEDRPHIVRDNVELAHVECFLSLVAQFELSSKASMPKRILITSTVPGEGKSMMASNLAATFTRYGRKTVLIDCDFRRPMQQRYHRLDHDEGLLAWAARGFPMTDDLLRPGGPVGITLLPDGTSLLPAGGVDVQPGHVLVARPMTELFARLSAAFEIVIVDSPPAGVFQDAQMLSRYCQESIVVLRDRCAHLSQLKKMLADLQKTTAPVVGLVLNFASLQQVHPSIGSRYGYGKYGYGKGGYDKNYSYKAAPYADGRSPKAVAKPAVAHPPAAAPKAPAKREHEVLARMSAK